MPVEAGIAFVFGANIGTSLNVFLLSNDKSITARRAAGAHLGIKGITALIGAHHTREVRWNHLKHLVASVLLTDLIDNARVCFECHQKRIRACNSPASIISVDQARRLDVFP